MNAPMDATPDHTQQADHDAPTGQTANPPTPTPAARVAALVVAVVGVVGLMFLAIGAPAVSSGADDLPLAVSGPPAAVEQLVAAVEANQPGAFDVTTHDSLTAVEDAVIQREAIGGIALSADGATVVLASAAGTPYAGVLRGVGAALEAQGQGVTYDDVAPLTSDDAAGAGLTAMGLPLIFGGMISAVLLSTLLRGRGPGWRIAASLSFAILAGLVVTGILQFVFGTTSSDYWAVAGCVALGIAAISLTVLGFESLLGYGGLALGAVTMLFIANPLSGFATGSPWLPSPWGEIGQILPVGAAGTAIRSAAYFDGNGAAQALLVLAAWAIVGITLILLATATRSRRNADAH